MTWLHILGEITPLAWVLLCTAAAFVGLSKTAIPGINTISIAILAALISAKESTGAMLLLLIIGDVFALASYRKHANIPALIRLIPAVLVGLAVGAAFLFFSSNDSVRVLIGVILLLTISLTVLQRRRARHSDSHTGADPLPAPARFGFGALGGFTTMVANAGGPVMSMYFLASRFSVKEFLGTAAWFFAIVNLSKVPISIGLGLINPFTSLLALALAPAVIVGALIGRKIAHRLSQRVFENLVIFFTVAGSLYLVFG